jgi:hypothetical protein
MPETRIRADAPDGVVTILDIGVVAREEHGFVGVEKSNDPFAQQQHRGHDHKNHSERHQSTFYHDAPPGQFSFALAFRRDFTRTAADFTAKSMPKTLHTHAAWGNQGHWSAQLCGYGCGCGGTAEAIL